MATPKQAQEAALLAMIKQLLPEQEILGSEIETIYAAVDYIRELGGNYLVVKNPNAKAQCGCGESFAV